MPKLVRNWKSWDDEVKKQKKLLPISAAYHFVVVYARANWNWLLVLALKIKRFAGRGAFIFLPKRYSRENKERTEATPKPECRSLFSAATLQRWAPFYRKSAATADVVRGSAGITWEWGRGRVCKLLGGRRVTTTTCWAIREEVALWHFRRGQEVIGCLTDRLGCWKQWRKRHHDKHNADLLSDSVHII